MNPIAEDILMHYGVKRRSGRYPWGSGENPYQHGGDFLARVEELEAMGKSQKEIAEELKMSTTDLRMQVRVAKHERRALQAERAKSLREEGKTLDEIAKIMGYNNDSSVRALLNENTASNKNKALATAEALKKELAVKGALDVGEGVEQQLGVSKGVLQEALFILETEGYNRYGVGVPQVNDPKKRTITPVISVPDIEQRDAYQNLDIIKSVGDYHSSDGGASWDKREYPASIDSSRVKVLYGDEGGSNKDGVIEIRRGVADLDLGNVHYQYAVMRENINEDVATAIMVGDGREPDDEMKISEDHIRSIWNDNDLYTIHYDVDIEAAKAELQGSKTSMSFGENYIYAEAVIAAALYAREKYKGTGTPDFFCTPHMVNVMLLARDMNGRRIYTSKADLAAALNVGELYTAEQFEGLVRMDDEGHKHKLLGIFVNLTDYTVGSTKGGEITRFDQFDIDFNQQKYLIETRLSGALTRVYSAIALEEPVAAFTSGGTGGDSGGAGTP